MNVKTIIENAVGNVLVEGDSAIKDVAEDIKNKLVKIGKKSASVAEDLKNKTSDSAKEVTEDLIDKTANKAKEVADDIKDNVTNVGKKAIDAIDAIKDNPALSAAVAASIAAGTGALILRKRMKKIS